MNKKRILTYLIIILITLSIVLINNKRTMKPKPKEEIKIEEKIDKQEETKEIEPVIEEQVPKEKTVEEKKVEPKKEVKKEETKKVEKKEVKPTTPSKPYTPSKPSTPSNPTTITYTCPSGYKLNGTKCIDTISATLTCPNGYTNYSYNGLSGCVNLSEGYVTTDRTCKSGEGILLEIHLGEPDVEKCLPVHQNSYYKCPNGYKLENNNMCTKTIDATKK